MNSYLKQATAAQSRALGPFVDDTDFKTAETGLTIANTDIKLIINGAASADKNSGGGTHRINGVYGVTFDATDTATVGEMYVSVKVAGALAVFHSFIVVEEAVYDALFAASALGYVANATVNVTQLSGDTTAADNAEAFFDGTGYAGTNNVIPLVTAVTTVNGLAANTITATAIAADAITAAKVADGTIDAATFAAGAITATAIADGAIDAGAIADGAIDAATFAAGAIDAAAIANNAIDRATFAADTGLQTIRSNTAQAGSGTTITLDASASAVDDFYNNAIIYITGGTGVGQARFVSDYVGATKVATVPTWATNPDNTSTFAILPFGAIPGATAPTAAEVADAVWDEARAGHVDAGSFGEGVIVETNSDKTDYTIASGGIASTAFAAGAIDAAAIAANAIGAAEIANGAIDAATFAAGAIDAAAIADGAIDAATFAAGAITAAAVADGAIDAATFAAGAITATAIADGAIDAATFAAGAIDATAIAANAIGASELAQDAAQEIADEILNRNLAGGGSGNTRNVRNALRALRNRVGIAGGTATIYQEDDSSSAWTAAVTTTAGDPISEVDPA